ncbi:MAG: hypothetical protein AAGK97_16680, partial [Bacteroidota bacterium]
MCILLFSLGASIAFSQLPFDPDTVQFKRMPFEPLMRHHNFMEIDDNGVIWFGSTGIYQCFGDKWEKFNFFDQVDEESVSSIVVGITKDTSGNILIGHYHGGFSYHNIFTKKSKQVLPSKLGWTTWENRLYSRGFIPFKGDSIVLS